MKTDGMHRITFEQGYERLKRIVGRLDDDDISVDEMCRLFAEGKSLEKELRGYLEQQQGRLDEIEAGENLPSFLIVSPSQPQADEHTDWDSVPVDGNGSARGGRSDPLQRSSGASVDDDIPF